MSDYGTAVVRRNDDGRLSVVQADDTIGVSVGLLAEGGAGLPADADGCLLLAGDPEYRYRPVRFASVWPGGPPSVLVCERVREAAEGVG